MNAMRTLKILYLLLAGVCYLFFCLYLPQFSAYLLLCILLLPALLFFAAHYSGAKLQAELVPPKPHAHIGEPFSCCVRLKNPTIFPISTVIFRIHLENETLTELDDVEFHEAVPPRQTVCIHVPVTPEHAGAVHVTLQSIQVLDTLLLFSHRKRFSAAFSVTALPEVPQPPASTSPLQAGEDAVIQPTTEPEEFLGVREYRSGDRMRAIADKLRLEEGEAIESKMLTRMIESAQRKVEGRNYDIRKQLLEFDDVQNDQRHEIYGLRNQILESEDISELVKNLREGLFTDLFRAYVPAETVEEQWDLDGLQTKLAGEFGIVIDFKQLLDSNDQFTDDDLLEALLKQAEAQYVEKEQMVGHEAFTGFARSLLLQILDQLWRQHISALEALRQGIYLRGYAQKQPKQEYKREAFNMFEQLLDQIRETLVRVLMQVQINVKPAEEPAQQQPVEEPAPAEATGSALENMPKEELDPALFAHVGRNDPCPCGSGRRFKDCHGRLS